MAADDVFQSTLGETIVSAGETEQNKTFGSYKLLVGYREQAKQLQTLIDKQTEELAEAKKAPEGEFQRAHIHQINNILFRSGYELDLVNEETRRTLRSNTEELQIDWNRMRSNWVQNDDQLFQLQVILAKCEFLKQHTAGVDADGDLVSPLNKLTEEIGRFTGAHLSAGSLPDSSLEYLSETVKRLGEVFAGAYELATEVPEWRAGLAEPKPGSLSAAMLNEVQNKIKTRIGEIPSEISQVQRLLPDGSWRKEPDLRPEIFAFAEILHPKSPVLRLPVKEILHYLENHPDSRLRRLQTEKLKSDDARCKSWMEVREKHELQLNQAVALAREGNYLQAEEFIGQTPPLFSDLNYRLYKDAAKLWLDQRDQLRTRLSGQLRELESRLKVILGQPWIPMPRGARVRKQLALSNESLEKESKALEKYSRTDFYRETQPIFEEIRARASEIEEWAQKRRAFCRLIAIAEAGALAAILGALGAEFIYSQQLSQASLTVEVVPNEANDSAPEINLGGFHQQSFHAQFTNLSPGRYVLTVDSPGFYPQTDTVILEPGKPQTWGPIQMIPISGILRLEPTDASYEFQARSLNDQGKESDPLKIGPDHSSTGKVIPGESTPVKLRPGRYRVYFCQGSFGDPKAETFNVVTEVAVHQVTSYKPDFSFATLQITTKPAGATVSLNGKPVGTTPYSQKLAPITYSLDVSLNGFQSYYAPLQLDPGGRLPLNLDLHPLSGASAENVRVPEIQLEQDQFARKNQSGN